jgi:hypothetical protein
MVLNTTTDKNIISSGLKCEPLLIIGWNISSRSCWESLLIIFYQQRFSTKTIADFTKIICTIVLLCSPEEQFFPTQGTIVAVCCSWDTISPHFCGWRGQNLEESSMLKPSKVSWIISLWLNLYLHCKLLLVEIRECYFLLSRYVQEQG